MASTPYNAITRLDIPKTAAPPVNTFAGSGGAGQVAGVQFGPVAAPNAYAYRLTAPDTPATVAAALAALVPGATAVGAILTIPTSFPVQVAIGADSNGLQEVRRQEQGVRVSIWAPTPAVRDTLASAADLAFAALTDANGNRTEFAILPAGDTARIRYRSSFSDDKPGKAHVWRRDLCYTAEYGTTVLQAFPQCLFFGGTINKSLGGAATFGATPHP